MQIVNATNGHTKPLCPNLLVPPLHPRWRYGAQLRPARRAEQNRQPAEPDGDCITLIFLFNLYTICSQIVKLNKCALKLFSM